MSVQFNPMGRKRVGWERCSGGRMVLESIVLGLWEIEMPLNKRPKPRGRPPAASFDDTRERIMAAAERLFATNGYDKTSTKDIAEAARLTPPALYHYFDSKESLFVATLEDRASKLMAKYEAGAASQVGVLDKLCALLDVAVAVNRDDENISLFVLSAAI